MIRSSVSPIVMSERASVTKSSMGAASALVHAEHRQERLLWDLDRPDPLHPLLAFLLLLEQLPLAGDVPTVALGEHVLPHGPDRLARDHVGADGRLDRDLEHLARDQLLQPFDQRT